MRGGESGDEAIFYGYHSKRCHALCIFLSHNVHSFPHIYPYNDFYFITAFATTESKFLDPLFSCTHVYMYGICIDAHNVWKLCYVFLMYAFNDSRS